MSTIARTYEIHEIVDHSEELQLVARWINAEWSNREGYAVAETELWCTMVARSLRSRLFAARLDGATVGCGALLQNDLPIREVLRPWVGCLYVLPEYRGAGICAAMMQRVREAARALGHDALHLWAETDRLVETYKRAGFVELERLVHSVGPITIMKTELRPDISAYNQATPVRT